MSCQVPPMLSNCGGTTCLRILPTYTLLNLQLLYWLELMNVKFLVKCIQNQNLNPTTVKYSAFFTSFTRAGTTGCKKYTRMTKFYHNQKVINILEPLAMNKYSKSTYMTYLILVHFITPARCMSLHISLEYTS